MKIFQNQSATGIELYFLLFDGKNGLLAENRIATDLNNYTSSRMNAEQRTSAESENSIAKVFHELETHSSDNERAKQLYYYFFSSSVCVCVCLCCVCKSKPCCYCMWSFSCTLHTLFACVRLFMFMHAAAVASFLPTKTIR